MNAHALFRECVEYLEAAGWYRDGDDPGIWSLDGVLYFASLGSALTTQLEADGVSLLEAA